MNETQQRGYNMIKGIIFDMDGTILNTLTDITLSVNHALTLFHLPTKTESDIKLAVGNGALKLIERVTPETFSKDQIHEVWKVYQAYYDQHSNDHTGPYPGILELLYKLKAKGLKLAVVSNKFEHLVQSLNIEIFKGYFDASVGEVHGIPIKPDPAMVYKALHILGLEPNEVLYVGDSEVDIITAQNANLDSVGVTWGFRSEALLRSHHANHIIHHPIELLSIISGGQRS
jgi:phosphoglycolate phosphatase